MTLDERNTRFECLYLENYKRLYNYALYLTGVSELAQDIVADVFEMGWEQYASIDLKRADAYFFICVRNACYDWMNKKKVTGKYVAYAKRMGEMDVDTFDEYDGRIEEIGRIIEEMPPKTRFVLQQCYYEKKKYEEVAIILEMTSSGVRKHIMKGLDMIRERFHVHYKKSSGTKKNGK